MNGSTTWRTDSNQDVTLHVWRLRWWENDDLVIDGLALLYCTVAVAGAIGWAIQSGSLIQGIGSLLVGGFFGAIAYSAAVGMWGDWARVSIRVTGTHVVIRDPELSPEPREIPRGQILAAQIDASVPERRGFLRRGSRRQPEAGVGIFGKTAARNVQAIRLGPTEPRANLAILLRSPLRQNGVRRFNALLFPARLLGWSAWCIFATLEDPDAAREAFERWGVVRDIEDPDLVGRGPSAEDRRRARRALWVGTAFVLVWVGGLILLGILAAR